MLTVDLPARYRLITLPTRRLSGDGGGTSWGRISARADAALAAEAAAAEREAAAERAAKAEAGRREAAAQEARAKQVAAASAAARKELMLLVRPLLIRCAALFIWVVFQ